jgi:diacylglycerol kinase family enzyme
LTKSGAFDVYEVQPDAIAATVKRLVAAGVRRVLVAGGDGTIATAAAVLAGTPTELAVLPAGTLNHFARHLGISTVAAEALALATGAACRSVDVGVVNGRIFLNTSSVGAYVRFVRMRESLEPTLGYGIASTVAAFRILFTLRLMAVEVDVGDTTRIFRTALVFIGVGERELQLPRLGERVPNGKRGLHMIVVSGRSRARLLALGLAAVARGVDSVSRTPDVESIIVDRLRIGMHRAGMVAVDGEIERFAPPLEYELRRDALRVVCPPPESLLAGSS